MATPVHVHGPNEPGDDELPPMDLAGDTDQAAIVNELLQIAGANNPQYAAEVRQRLARATPYAAN